jgi:N-acetyl-alpha-D-muramate 1-phosphate uridylyltransferase
MSRAMILAAGLGTRLLPLTKRTPKALLPYKGKPMLEHVMLKLRDAGITEIIINIHHKAEHIIDYVLENKGFGLKVMFSDESDQLLDTGGGIAKARIFFEGQGTFIVYNIDIFSNIDLKQLLKVHEDGNQLATLAVKNRETSRNFLMDDQNLLCGWRNNQTGEEIITREKEDLNGTAFSGIHVLDDRIFPLLHEEGPFSITTAYLELSKKHDIYLYNHSKDHWVDMAHPSNFPSLKH